MPAPGTGLAERAMALPPGARAALAARLRELAAQACAAGERSAGRLVAYLVLDAGATAGPAAVRDYLAERLPAALIPSSFQYLDALPMLPSGKLDRRALPLPPLGLAGPGQQSGPPLTGTEERLSELVGAALGITPAGVHDEFWELGFDSLSAARLTGRIRHAFGVELDPAVFFESPSIARLARRIEEAGAGHPGPAFVPLVPAARAEHHELSSAELRHWLLQAMHPDSAEYNIGDVLEITGELDVEALRRSIAALVDRHEILRTRYRPVEGEPAAEILPAGEIPLPLADLTAFGPSDAQRVAGELLAADLDRPFALDRPPLVRMRLIRLSGDRYLLGVVAHHIVADDWAFDVLYAELSVRYRARAGGRPDPVPAGPARYRDYAAWERRLLAAELDAGLAFWRDELGGLRSSTILPPAADRLAQAAQYRFTIPDDLAGRLAAQCRTRSVTKFAACLAAYAVALGEVTGHHEVVVGVPFVNRERPEFEAMIGCFINPAAIRVDLTGTPSRGQLLDRAARAVTAAYARQHVPFERVTEAVRRARAEAGADGSGPLFDVVLNFVTAPTVPELPGARVERLAPRIPAAPAKYPLTLYLEQAGLTLRGWMTYAPGSLTAPVAAEVAATFLRALRWIAAAGDDHWQISAGPAPMEVSR